MRLLRFVDAAVQKHKRPGDCDLARQVVEMPQTSH